MNYNVLQSRSVALVLKHVQLYKVMAINSKKCFDLDHTRVNVMKNE